MTSDLPLSSPLATARSACGALLAPSKIPGETFPVLEERQEPAAVRAMQAARAREQVLEDLKVRIRTIERRPPELKATPGEGDGSAPPRDTSALLPASSPWRNATGPRASPGAASDWASNGPGPAGASVAPWRLPAERQPAPAWTLAASALDTLLGPEGLAIDAVHEVKPANPEPGHSFAAGWAAARAFALALGVRRCHAMGATESRQAPVLCCWPAALAHELAPLYGPGLRTLGLDPDRLLIAETATAAEALWALEEGLRSASLALVLGMLEDVPLTPARRLALAAAASRTPCLLLTHPRAGATAATATRWRVGPCPSEPSRFDARAPGVPRFAVRLEWCRSRPAAEAVSVWLEWCHEAYRFRLASRLADRAAAAGRAERRAG